MLRHECEYRHKGMVEDEVEVGGGVGGMSPGDERGYGDASSRGGDGGYGDGGYGGTGQTRTRLPDRPGDVYGGARRGRGGASRSMVTVVAVVVVLIAAIAFANRGGSGGKDGGSSSDGARSGGKAASAPTSATGKRPVGTRTSGIPTGYAHDQQGAQSAATNYAVAMGGTGMFNKDTRHVIVDTVYTKAAAGKLQGVMDDAYSPSFLDRLGLKPDGSPPSGSTFVSRTVPVGSKVKDYTNDTASISVWYMGLLGMAGAGSTDPVTSSWSTWTFDLRWTDGDWKIVSDSQKDGPTPVPGDDKAAASDEISKAVEEYGGFTYAR
ncbi:hypothetical protein QFZ64_003345 [Streptomyces sp. B3I8]|nr:hypothetical protein [Streptomyces sp. B3I8]